MPQSQVHVDTDLQAIVVKATLHKPIHIYSIFIPPHDLISDIEMNKLLRQIPKPYLLLGDKQPEHCMGVPESQQKGQNLEKVIQNYPVYT